MALISGGRGPARNARGIVFVEFALVLLLLILIALGTIDYGRLIQQRLVLTNVCREGGSIASRQSSVDPALMTMLAASASPLALDGADGRIYVTRISAGTSSTSRRPTITTQLSRGGLAVPSQIGTGQSNLGLTSTIYNHLIFDSAQGVSDITDVTVVEVYYRYRPITPIGNFPEMSGVLTRDGEGLIISSRAVF